MREFKKGDRFLGEVVFTEVDSDGDPNFDLIVNGEAITSFYIARGRTGDLDALVPLEDFNQQVKEKHFADPADVERFLS